MMVAKDHSTTHSTWQRFLSAVLLIALVVGSLLLVNGTGTQVSGLHVAWSKSEVVTLTGYGQLSPMNPSSDPIAVVLSHQQVNALNDVASALTLTSSEAFLDNRSIAIFQKVGVSCHENSLVFSLSVTSRQGEVSKLRIADWECPAPGMLIVQSQSGIQTFGGLLCPVDHLIARYLSWSSAKGTLSVLKHCSENN
jgi:hypothetical protein